MKVRPVLERLIRDAFALNETDEEIAMAAGYSAAYIARLRRALGLYREIGPKPQDDVRIEAICHCLESGKTLQEVGDELLITRERVRQLALKHGFRAKPARKARTDARRQKFREQRKTERDARYAFDGGCTYAEARSLNDGLALSDTNSKWWRYKQWKRNANGSMHSKAIISFPQWVALVGEHFDEIGRGFGYQIRRINRHKPFTLDNVVLEQGNEGAKRQLKETPWNFGGAAKQ